MIRVEIDGNIQFIIWTLSVYLQVKGKKVTCTGTGTCKPNSISSNKQQICKLIEGMYLLHKI